VQGNKILEEWDLRRFFKSCRNGTRLKLEDIRIVNRCFPISVTTTLTLGLYKKVLKSINGHYFHCNETIYLIMAAQCNRAGHYIFALRFLSFFLLSFFLFSWPNLSGRKLDVYHSSTHGVALVRI